jgi:hypothetical protein
VMAARCGRPMRRHERTAPQLEDPVCGKRPGHRGTCRSEAAVERIRLYEAARWKAGRKPRGGTRHLVLVAEVVTEAYEGRPASWPVTRETAA